MAKMFSKVALIVWLLGLTFIRVQSQNGYAAVLTVIYDDIQIRRANTEAWLTLPKGAEAPLGPGDVIQTSAYGRAYLTFLDQAQVLVLPNTIYELQDFDQTETGLRLSASLSQGQLVQSLSPDSRLDFYRLETDYLTVSNPAASLAIWHKKDQYTVLTVSHGEAQVTANGEDLSISESTGARVTSDGHSNIEALPEPLSAARLIGRADGCPAEIQTPSTANLNVRVGPGFNSTVIGSIQNHTTIFLMGVNEANRWYRIQAFSGFGWVRTALVKSDCSNIPVLGNDILEDNIGLWDVQQRELDLLLPFYGPPEGDLWFYRSLETTN